MERAIGKMKNLDILNRAIPIAMARQVNQIVRVWISI